MRELRERAGPVLKIVCLILAALVVYQLAGIFIRWNPFRGVTVPALPSLTTSTNSPAGVAQGTNLAASAIVNGTNRTQLPAEPAAAPSVMIANTNSVLLPMLSEKGTNSIVHPESAKTGTDVVASLETKLNGTNSAPATNFADKGTSISNSPTIAGTNTVPVPKPERVGMNSNPFQPPGNRGGDLSPAMQARISRITDSEILGPVMHPLPMGLMGIAGEFAFLRSASGQTGLVKEGDSLDDIKLLRIGINRVLIEQDGQKKELTIFSGYGGESLLPKQNDTPNENKNQ